MAVEIAAPRPLTFLAVALATAFLFSAVRQHTRRLLRRSRWLLVALFVAYALSLPGVPLLPAWGWMSPSAAGLEAGALRVARLLLLLGGLAVLLASTARPLLLQGLYVLAKPLAWLGLDRRAFAVRLGLTLEYAEAAKDRAWRASLDLSCPDDGHPSFVSLPVLNWQTRDSAVILAALLLPGLTWAWG